MNTCREECFNEKSISVKKNDININENKVDVSNYWKIQAELIQMQNFKL